MKDLEGMEKEKQVCWHGFDAICVCAYIYIYVCCIFLHVHVVRKKALVQFICCCIGMYARGEEVNLLASMAKLKAGRLVREVADSCLQFWGGMGYSAETLVSRLYRDLRLLSIGGGADEVMLSVICKLAGLLPSKKKRWYCNLRVYLRDLQMRCAGEYNALQNIMHGNRVGVHSRHTCSGFINYLRQEVYVFTSVCLFVCLSVCRHISKRIVPIFMNVCGKVGHRAKTNLVLWLKIGWKIKKTVCKLLRVEEIN